MALEKGYGQFLVGTPESRSHWGRKTRCCMSLRRSSLFLRNSSHRCTLASWRVLIVSMSCCSVGASTPLGVTDIGCGCTGCVGCASCSSCSVDIGCVVYAACVILTFRILLKNFEHKCGWDQVLSGPTVGAKCSCRLTWPSVVSRLVQASLIPCGICSFCLLNAFTCRDRGLPYGRLHSDAQVSKGSQKQQ